jgi:hypothetical protein
VMPESIASGFLMSTMVILPHYTYATRGRASHQPLIVTVVHERPTAGTSIARRISPKSGRGRRESGESLVSLWQYRAVF